MLCPMLLSTHALESVAPAVPVLIADARCCACVQFVRLVFERPLHAEAGEWRICDLQPLPAAL